jgi:hypothetical protein
MGGSGRGREIADGELADVSGLASSVVRQDGCVAILSGLAIDAWLHHGDSSAHNVTGA